MPRPAALAATLVSGLVSGLLLSAGLPGSAQAAPVATAAGDLKYTKTAIKIETLVGPAGNMPCTVTADLYKPDGVTRTNPAPAILTTHGFGGTKGDDGQVGAATAFAKRGYVVISYSGLGFGGTQCKITLDDRDHDGQAGKQIVDVLAGAKSYTLDSGTEAPRIDYVATEEPGDPKVGMIGGSYGGQIQFAVAALDPRIDALIPTITWNDLSYSLAPNNTDRTDGVTYATPGVAKKQWIGLFFALGIVAGLEYGGADPKRNVGCPNFTDQACAAAAQLQTLGYPDDATLKLARNASVASYLKAIKVPTLLVQGQRDTLFNLQEAIATYRALKRQGTPVAMSWFSGGHSGDTLVGDLDLSGGVEASHQGRRWINWMDRYVRGDGSAGTGPEFEYFRDWVTYAGKAIDPAYAEMDTFTGAPTSTLYLAGTNALTASRSSVTTGAAPFAVSPAGTSYSELSGLGGMLPSGEGPPSDTPGTFASYTTAPLREDAVLVGSPRLTARIEAPVAAAAQATGPLGKLVLFAKLYDVAPNGTQKLQHRLISPVRVKDVTRPVEIALPAVAQRFPAGHRLRLVIAGGDSAYGTNATAQPVTIRTSRQSPGTLKLPLVGAASAGCPAGTSGSRPFCEVPTPAVPSAPGAGAPTPGAVAPTAPSGAAGSGAQGATVLAPGSAAGPVVSSTGASADVASALPDTGAPRWLRAGAVLGLLLLMAGLVLVRRQGRIGHPAGQYS